MKKTIIALVAVLLIGGGVALLTSGKNDSSGDKASTSKRADQKQAKGTPACELLTLADAKTVIGANAVLANGEADTNLASTESVDVDNCTYSADGATIGDFTQITIQRHYGDTAQVKQAYENYKKEYPGEALTGHGDQAYYATETKQVQVLAGDYWLNVFGGSINAGDAGNRDIALKAAKLAVEKL